MLNPRWIEEAAATIDIFHLHFSFRTVDERMIRHSVATLKSRGVPLVYTANDLRDNIQNDTTEFDQKQAILISEADRVITSDQ
jgi:hypothetical protein